MDESRQHTEKTLRLDGREIAFSAPAGDVYLGAMGRDGPVDLIPIFDAYCDPTRSVVDVGANIGVTAVLAAHRCPDATVVALEPIPATFGHLARNVESAGLANVVCVEAAAGAAAGEAPMLVHDGWGFGAFVGYDGVRERYEDFAEHCVDVRTLDEVAATLDLGPVGFVKIDTEGYELEVLAGAAGLLAESDPVVLMEANHYCLNVFRRTSIVTFVERVCAIFESVLAVDTDGRLLDLQHPGNHQHFFHENVVSGRFPNLLCGPRERIEAGFGAMGATFAQ